MIRTTILVVSVRSNDTQKKNKNKNDYDYDNIDDILNWT